MTTKRLFLPIEIKKREFDAKLLLAFFALEKVWKYILEDNQRY